MTIGEAIIAAREKRGFTRDALAEKSGVSKVTIYQWETDRFMPTIALLIFVADALGVTLDELVGREAPSGKAQP